MKNQTIEEFLVGKIYYDGYWYNMISKYNRKTKYFTEYFNKKIHDNEGSQQSISTILNNIIKIIKEHPESNKDLFNELVKLYPEYLI